MRSDVPFGAFLSGGLDSASIVTAMSENTNVPIETFTIGFDHAGFDERSLAKAVAIQQDTNHHEQVVTPALFDDALSNVAFHYDEPFGDSSAIPTSYVSEFAARHVKMVLTGDGGDEVLSGYPAYQVEKFVRRYQTIPSPLKNVMPNVLQLLNKASRYKHSYRLGRLERLLRTSDYSFKDRLLAKIAWLERERRDALLVNYQVMPVEEFLDDFMRLCPYKDSFYRLMYFNLKLSLPDDMLTKVDRMSMAYSLEARVPFLDYRLVEYMTGVHKSVKLQRATRKSVLRNTMGKRLPRAILNAPKAGFVVPLREWFKDDEFGNRLNSLVDAEWKLDQSQIRDIIDQNNRGEKDYGNLIWMLFLLREAV
jgi:asparagine synthase (glutamine-hydrolysing)